MCYVVVYFYFILFSDERLHFQALFCKIFINLFYLSFMFHVFILFSFILFLICIYLIFYFLYLFYIFYLFISLYCIVLLLIILFLDKRLPYTILLRYSLWLLLQASAGRSLEHGVAPDARPWDLHHLSDHPDTV